MRGAYVVLLIVVAASVYGLVDGVLTSLIRNEPEPASARSPESEASTAISKLQ